MKGSYFREGVDLLNGQILLRVHRGALSFIQAPTPRSVFADKHDFPDIWPENGESKGVGGWSMSSSWL